MFMIKKWVFGGLIVLTHLACQPAQNTQAITQTAPPPENARQSDSKPSQKEATEDELQHLQGLVGKNYLGESFANTHQQLALLKGYEVLGGGLITSIERNSALAIAAFRKESTYIITLERTTLGSQPRYLILDAVQIKNVPTGFLLATSGFVHYQGQPDNSLIAFYDPKQSIENGQYVSMWKVIKADLEAQKLKSFDQQGVSVPSIVP
ncbi:MAG: hypothetical protein OHK0053_02750 [Microscillaceae bacterium]